MTIEVSGGERSQDCPCCGAPITMTPYDIGSGPEMSCPQCEWCWGADGQPLRPLTVATLLDAAYRRKEAR